MFHAAKIIKNSTTTAKTTKKGKKFPSLLGEGSGVRSLSSPEITKEKEEVFPDF